MSNDSEQVTALIRELIILNRAESAPTLEVPTVEEIDERKSKRKRIRQELVQVLSQRPKKTSATENGPTAAVEAIQESHQSTFQD